MKLKGWMAIFLVGVCMAATKSAIFEVVETVPGSLEFDAVLDSMRTQYNPRYVDFDMYVMLKNTKQENLKINSISVSVCAYLEKFYYNEYSTSNWKQGQSYETHCFDRNVAGIIVLAPGSMTAVTSKLTEHMGLDPAGYWNGVSYNPESGQHYSRLVAVSMTTRVYTDEGTYSKDSVFGGDVAWPDNCGYPLY